MRWNPPSPFDFSRPSSYRLFLKVGQNDHAIEFSDKRVTEIAKSWSYRPSSGSIDFDLPQGVDRLMWGAQQYEFAQLFGDAKWPPFLVFDLEPFQGKFAQKSAVVIRLMSSDGTELFSKNIRLKSPRPLVVPLSTEVAGLACHIRLAGAGRLPPVTLRLSIPDQIAVERYLLAGARIAGPTKADERPDGLRGLVKEAGDRRFAWDGILKEAIDVGSSRYLIGITSADDAGAGADFHNLRVDQSVSAHNYINCRGYIFDDRGHLPFGWRGVMTADNNIANAALAQHLKACRTNGIPSALLYDRQSLTKPFLADFRKHFDESHQVAGSLSVFGDTWA